MRRVDQWLTEYGESHRHPTNKRLHWICVPVIVWCVIALLWSVPTGGRWHAFLNFGVLAAAAALAYYALLSAPLALGALPILLAMIASLPIIEHSRLAPVWHAAVVLFVLAWIGQFIGHKIEGKRPSFLKDILFLLIGPLWLLADVYRRLGIRY
ncbi:MAG TPA: DUF962 domain-containing protein [Steroidobacteraceae bacterium]|nr:DUF962 domain-containing protein [Steroidobacteraceae bacterium]